MVRLLRCSIAAVLIVVIVLTVLIEQRFQPVLIP
jgi:hypothetical protein